MTINAFKINRSEYVLDQSQDRWAGGDGIGVQFTTFTNMTSKLLTGSIELGSWFGSSALNGR